MIEPLNDKKLIELAVSLPKGGKIDVLVAPSVTGGGFLGSQVVTIGSHEVEQNVWLPDEAHIREWLEASEYYPLLKDRIPTNFTS